MAVQRQQCFPAVTQLPLQKPGGFQGCCGCANKSFSHGLGDCIPQNKNCQVLVPHSMTGSPGNTRRGQGASLAMVLGLEEASVVELLPGMARALGSIPNTT